MTIKWTTAFNRAIDFVILTIFWDIIGGILIIFGSGGLLGAILGKLTTIVGLSNTTSSNLSGSALLFSLGFLLIGVILILLGNIATFLKVFGDAIADEVEARQNRKIDVKMKDNIKN